MIHMSTFDRVLKTGVLLSLLLACTMLCAEAAETNMNIIDVSGTGTVKVAADQVEISLAVNTKGPDISEIQRENAEKMTNIISALKSDAGLLDKEITTSYYSVSEEWNPSDALKATYGEKAQIYRVSNTISIVTGKVADTGHIVDVGIANGANSIDSLQFSLTADTNRKYREQALQIAVEKAHADAKVVAQALGMTLGEASYAQVGSSYVTPYQANKVYSMGRGDVSVDEAGGSPTPIEAGEVEVSASVSISYKIV